MRTCVAVSTALVLAVTSLLFIACEKERVAPSVAVAEGQGHVKLESGGAYTFFDDGNGHYGCNGAPKDCMQMEPDELQRKELDDIFSSVVSGDPSKVRDAFKRHEVMLLRYMQQTEYDDVVNFREAVTCRDNGTNNRCLIITSKATGTGRMVYQFI